ncbi:MAG: PEP-CTERM sorting domain-containing protein [Pseudanabaena sp.]|nr:MAG: PEP-CTERM sorting domain-containing protein [Pseudanabaena sp.]
MQSQIKQKLLTLSLATVASLSIPSQINAMGFTGAYDVGNFTLTNSPILGNGSVDTTNAATGSIVLNGSDDPTNNPNIAVITDFTITINSSRVGTVSFDWSYFTLDEPAGDDTAGYFVNSNFTPLAVGELQSSIVTVSESLSLGDTFGFRVSTSGNIGERGEFTVSNFHFVPVPFEFSPIFGLATLGALAVFKKIRKL